VKRENIHIISNLSCADNMNTSYSALKPLCWAKGLDRLAASEWFIDCYRMRLDDEAVYQSVLRGLYDYDEASPISIVKDFLMFCKLAVFNSVVHEKWDWELCFRKFGHLLNCAFEKSDAQEKYGSENYFSALMGGRSLRATGEAVYKSPITETFGEETITDDVKATRSEQKRLEKAIRKLKWKDTNPIFENVGGFDVWNKLLHKVGEVDL
jgi:hypothetical protein